MSLAGKNLLDGPAPTFLPEEPELTARVLPTLRRPSPSHRWPGLCWQKKP